MIIRLGRLTPGYFRLLQRQVAGEVQAQPQDRAVNQIAMMLAIMGLSLSYYSAKQMTEKVQAQPAPWRDLTTRDRGDNGWADEKWRRWSEKAEAEPWRCPPGPHFSHLTVIFTLWHWISGIPLSPCAEISWLLLRVFYTFCCRDLEGFVGMAHGGVVDKTGFTDWFGWVIKTSWLPNGSDHQLLQGYILARCGQCCSKLQKLKNCEFCQCLKLVQKG